MTDADRKRLIWDLFQRLNAADSVETAALWARAMTPDAIFHAVHPMNDLAGPEGVIASLVAPLKFAIPDLERRTHVIMAGRFNEGDWVCAMGVFEGTMSGSWLGIPATDGLVNLRFGEFYRIEGDRIAEVYAIHDLVDLMRQAGINPLPASPAGVPDIFPAPITQDGVRFDRAPQGETEASLALVEAMIFGLHKFAEGDLKRMGMEQYWSPTMLWYGPGGIGSNRGVTGFQRHHQQPFLTAFPDRVGGNHKARFADGAYVASTGWPSITATHAGPWLGVPGTGGQITMRVMDWWRREGEALKENWVFIDVPHVMLQSGHDIFGNLK